MFWGLIKKNEYKLLEDKRLKLKNWKIKITPEKLELIIRKKNTIKLSISDYKRKSVGVKMST